MKKMIFRKDMMLTGIVEETIAENASYVKEETTYFEKGTVVKVIGDQIIGEECAYPISRDMLKTESLIELAAYN